MFGTKFNIYIQNKIQYTSVDNKQYKLNKKTIRLI